MAVIDFIRDAGENLIRRRKNENSADPSAVVTRLKQLGLVIDDLEIIVEGEKAVLKGAARSFGDREKALIVVGNVKGIAKVEDQLSPETGPHGASFFHTVVRGETLADIAQQHYGNAELMDQILIANHPVITHPSALYPGQKLRVPPLNDS